MRAITPVSLATVLAVTVLAATSPPARAQVALPAPAPVPRLGATAGQTLATTELALDYQRDVTRLEGTDPVTRSRYDFHVGFDRVVYPSLTLGLRLGFAGEVIGETSIKSFDLGGRFGGLVPVGGSTLWWPTAGLTYRTITRGDRDTDATVRILTLHLSGPFLWQPARHLLIGLGPTYSADVRSKSGPVADQPGPKTSGFGIHGFLGLWF